MRLKDKVAIVTGGAGGIGSATVRALAREGAQVVIGDVFAEGAEKLASEIRKTGSRGLTVTVDISKQDEVEQMVKKTIGELGRVDILVNVAAAPALIKTFSETSPADWKEEIDITFVGTLLCCRAVIPYMVRQRSGRIITVSSDASVVSRIYLDV